jgi:predicted nucleic acid-binding Zn ribbon protein
MTNLKKADRREPLKVFHCVVCGGPIASSRIIRKAVTCSEEHAEILTLERRRLRDLGKCRLCNRPSTPEERAEFAAWRRSQGETRGRKKKPQGEAELVEIDALEMLEAKTVLEA